MKHLMQTLARRFGYQFIRLDKLNRMRSQLASAELRAARRDAACDRLDAELNRMKAAHEQALADLNGYKTAYDQTQAGLSRHRLLLRESRRVGVAVRPFGFLHLQKTGGISLLQFLSGQFDELRTLWVFSPKDLADYHPGELAHYDFVCGHFSYSNVGQFRPGRVLCTFLRHPVERVLSCYWYFRTYRGPDRDIIRQGVASAKAKGLKEFLRDEHPEVRFHTVNHQTRALAGDWTAPFAEDLPDALEVAARHLDRFACVGLTERMEASVDLLCRVMGWQRTGPLGQLNRTPYRQQAADLSPRERDLILERNSLDLTLYERAAVRLRRDLDATADVRRAA
jgi:hypothetical protein